MTSSMGFFDAYLFPFWKQRLRYKSENEEKRELANKSDSILSSLFCFS